MARENSNLELFLDLLGRRCRDRITNIEGIIATVGFDLYGCIQAIVDPGQEGPKKRADVFWVDINRLEIIEGAKVMEPPNYQHVTPESIGVGILKNKPAGNGPAEKPAYRKF